MSEIIFKFSKMLKLFCLKFFSFLKKELVGKRSFNFENSNFEKEFKIEVLNKEIEYKSRDRNFGLALVAIVAPLIMQLPSVYSIIDFSVNILLNIPMEPTRAILTIVLYLIIIFLLSLIIRFQIEILIFKEKLKSLKIDLDIGDNHKSVIYFFIFLKINTIFLFFISVYSIGKYMYTTDFPRDYHFLKELPTMENKDVFFYQKFVFCDYPSGIVLSSEYSSKTVSVDGNTIICEWDYVGGIRGKTVYRKYLYENGKKNIFFETSKSTRIEK